MKSKILVIFVFLLGLCAPPALAQEAKFDALTLAMNLRPHRGQPEWRWSPDLRFDLYGPMSNASAVTVAYTLPNGKPFITLECRTETLGADESMTVTDCGRDVESDKATTLTGVFGFQIKQADELKGINKTLYTGKFTVNKYLYNPAKNPAFNKNFYYYVEQDWRLPFAYIFVKPTSLSNNLTCEVWIKRDTSSPDATGYLIYNGKTITESSPGSYLSYELDDNDDKEFVLLRFEFRAMTDPPASAMSGHWRLYENPGEYEIKVLRKGQLSRALKFAIGKDGKPVDNGIAKQNKIWDTGLIVPVQVLGDADGAINRAAFKEGIWGNPLSGFTPPQ